MIKKNAHVSPNRWVNIQPKFEEICETESDWYKIFYTPLSYLADEFVRIFEEADFEWNTKFDELFEKLPDYEQWFECIQINPKYSSKRYSCVGDMSKFKIWVLS